MDTRETLIDIFSGVVGGIVATHVNDYVEKVFWELTPETEKAREPETEDDSSAESAARMLLECVEDSPPEDEVEIAKMGVHYGLGAAWGPLYCWLRRHGGMSPLATSVTSGTALSLLVDETLNPVLGITLPNEAYPESAHVRGVMTHVIWGLVCGATAETLRRQLCD